MNNKVMYICTFALGAAVGTAVSWRIMKSKYAKIAQEEIDSVKERYSIKKLPTVEEEPVKEEPKEPEQVKEPTQLEMYKNFTDKLGYTDYSNEKAKGGESVKNEKPYVIAPEEFDEIDEYETISLTYYADGTLTDEDDEIIDDVEGTVGEDSLHHFGEYEDDSVFVRNDRLRTDYEILRDERRYSEVKRLAYPPNMEG